MRFALSFHFLKRLALIRLRSHSRVYVSSVRLIKPLRNSQIGIRLLIPITFTQPSHLLCHTHFHAHKFFMQCLTERRKARAGCLAYIWSPSSNKNAVCRPGKHAKCFKRPPRLARLYRCTRMGDCAAVCNYICQLLIVVYYVDLFRFSKEN